MEINEFFRITWRNRNVDDIYSYQDNRPMIICGDGTTLSVQASKSHYCNPRVDGNDIYYNSVEVGFPSIKPPFSWRDYWDGSEESFDNDGTNSVYGYIPVGMVQSFIESHGGISVSNTLPDYSGKIKCPFCGTWNDVKTSCSACGVPMP